MNLQQEIRSRASNALEEAKNMHVLERRIAAQCPQLLEAELEATVYVSSWCNSGSVSIYLNGPDAHLNLGVRVLDWLGLDLAEKEKSGNNMRTTFKADGFDVDVLRPITDEQKQNCHQVRVETMPKERTIEVCGDVSTEALEKQGYVLLEVLEE